MSIISRTASLLAVVALAAAMRAVTPAPAEAQTQTCSTGTTAVCQTVTIKQCTEAVSSIEAGKWFVGFTMECKYYRYVKQEYFWSHMTPQPGGGGTGGTGGSGGSGGAGGSESDDCGNPDLWYDDGADCKSGGNYAN
jgi:hypothetical protein